MCIRDRAYINHELCKACGMCKKACQYDAISEVVRPVSYTHLTLPTICSV
nr:4Fe-4S binding protein [Clostridioides difficile]